MSPINEETRKLMVFIGETVGFNIQYGKLKHACDLIMAQHDIVSQCPALTKDTIRPINAIMLLMELKLVGRIHLYPTEHTDT